MVHEFATEANYWRELPRQVRGMPRGLENKSRALAAKSLKAMVGAQGFEPWTR